jgi:hypothetical protein
VTGVQTCALPIYANAYIRVDILDKVFGENNLKRILPPCFLIISNKINTLGDLLSKKVATNIFPYKFGY